MKNEKTPFFLIFLSFFIFFHNIFLSFYHFTLHAERFDKHFLFSYYLYHYKSSLWLPHLYLGMPLFSNIEQGFFYPFSILTKILPPVWCINMIFIVHFLFGGIFIYLYAKKIGLSKEACLGAVFVFLFNGFLLGSYTHMFVLQSYVYIPLLLYLSEKFFENKKYIWLILIGLSLGLQALTGMFQFFYYTVLFLAGYFLFKKIILGLSLHRCFMVFIFVLIISLGIFAVQFFPVYEHYLFSARKFASFAQVMDRPGDTLQFLNILDFVFPEYIQGDFVNAFSPGHFGIISLFLALIAILNYKKAKYKNYILFYSIFFILTLLLAVGKYTPLYYILYHLRIPGFSVFKKPLRIEVLTMFTLAILVGEGIEILRKVVISRKQIFLYLCIFFIFAILICFHLQNQKVALSNPNYSQIINPERFPIGLLKFLHSLSIRNFFILIFLASIFFISLVIKLNLRLKYYLPILIFLNLYLFRNFDTPFFASGELKSSWFREPESVSLIKDKYSKLYRVASLANDDISGCSESNIRSLEEKANWYNLTSLCRAKQFYWTKKTLIENTPIIYDLHSSLGHIVLPTQRYLEFVKTDLEIDPMSSESYNDFIFHPNFLSLTSSSFVIVPRWQDKPYFHNRDLFERIYEDDELYIYYYRWALKKIFFVQDYIIMKNREEILSFIKSSHFDPKRTVIIETIPKNFQPIDKYRYNLKPKYTLEINDYQNDFVELKLSTDTSGFLVFLDAYHPGWKSYIDGKENRVLRANYIFKAIYIPDGGKYRITFKYKPFSFKIGCIISCLTAVFCIFGTIVWREKQMWLRMS